MQATKIITSHTMIPFKRLIQPATKSNEQKELDDNRDNKTCHLGFSGLGISRDDYRGPGVFIDPNYLGKFLDMTNRKESRPANLLDELMLKDLSKAALTGHAPEGSSESIEQVILKNNFILIHDVVDDQMANEVRLKTQLLAAAMKKTGKVKPVHFLVNSPGGSIVSMNAILDAMDRLKNTKIDGQNIVVATYCDGMAASAASVILANGTPGCRYISPRSEVMIHQPLGGFSGQATDLDIRNRRIQKMKQEITDFFVKTTKMNKPDLERVLERDYFMDSNESVTKGFVDACYDRFQTEELDLDVKELLSE